MSAPDSGPAPSQDFGPSCIHRAVYCNDIDFALKRLKELEIDAMKLRSFRDMEAKINDFLRKKLAILRLQNDQLKEELADAMIARAEAESKLP